MKVATLYMIPALAGVFGDAAEHVVGTKAADLAVWIGSALLFGFLLSKWWVQRK